MGFKIMKELYKTCTKCGKRKPNSEFHKQKGLKYGTRTSCAKCSNKRVSEYQKKIRIKVLLHYSKNNKLECECCGTTHYEFLVIDHIKGGGCEHRREIFGDTKGGFRFYRWIVNNNYPVGFRVLCHNCNMSLGLYGYCPHNNKNIEIYFNEKKHSIKKNNFFNKYF